jgi:SseB protein N-terminal domain
MPEITQEMRAHARANPNSWLYVIDPAFDADAEIPPWGVLGAYPVDASGEIGAEFRPNTGYRPVPATELEQLLRLVRAGQRDEATLPAAVLAAELLLYAASPDDRSVTGFRARQGNVMVPACTSAAHVPAAWPGWRRVTGRELAPLLHGHPLVINPTGPVTAMIPAEHLVRTASASG